jgi:hypothetical protein
LFGYNIRELKLKNKFFKNIFVDVSPSAGENQSLKALILGFSDFLTI